MPEFCDVALPVPVETSFTYRVNGREPVVGGRVLVPFRNQRLAGVVVELHDRAPSMAARNILQVLDATPALDAGLIELGRWLAGYYLAPLGEVLRTMLPLGAEVRRALVFRITGAGRRELHRGAQSGASLRSRRSREEQLIEYRVLDYLLDRDDGARLPALRAAGATRELLAGMVRKKWIVREDATATHDSTPRVQFAVLRQVEGKLNANQRRIVELLAAAGGRLRAADLRAGLAADKLPATTLRTLIKRGLVTLVEEPAEFQVSRLHPPAKEEFVLNPAQQRALGEVQRAVAARKFSVSLLHGVTGSGKTAVYLAAMRGVLAESRSAILLVPEIGLTPAAAAHLHSVFGDQVAILHSALSEAERAQQWRRIRRGEARMVVGTRSAVFAPVADLALLVVDEEHDSSYKQEETPRYHARDVAVMRGKMAGAAVVLGSATPSLESYHNTAQGKYALIELDRRVEERPLPDVELVDMREEFRQTQSEQVLSRRLLEALSGCLERGEQAMVLLNRRGYSAFVLCRPCGNTVQCENCAIAMTHHKGARRLLCHYCGAQQPVPRLCPKCGSEFVFFLGSGSEKLEELLHAAFPQARIARLDRDTVRGRHDFERVLNALHAGELDLLVGTQMIAKGHDVHGVTLVGVVGSDQALSFPDFRAAERTFQLLTQVAGRAGRGATPGKVVLQTYFPEHYAIQFAAAHDYAGFYEKELRFRSWMRYPPFSALANVLVRSPKMEEALRIAGAVGRWFESRKPTGMRVLGPAAAPILRLKRDYRYHFVLKSPSRQKLNATLRALLAHAAAQKISRANLIVDVDALSLL
jgi:primosomal protein N' (replication factor Y) (superfamily II helicase)